MKKTAIVLAVGAALAAGAAQAETTLYGSARVSLDYKEAEALDNLTDLGDFIDDGTWDVVNNSSRLGVRGSEDLGNGLSAIYQYEFGVDAVEGGNLNSSRPRVLGLKGGFGQISLGNQWTPYYNVAGVTDVFNTSNSFTNYLGGFRQNNTVYYASPNLNGFSAEFMTQFNGESLDTGLDSWQGNVKYSHASGFGVGLGYIGNEDIFTTVRDSVTGDFESTVRENSQWVAALSYAGGPLSAAVIYEDVESDISDVYGVVSYSFGSNIVRAAYGQVDDDLNDAETQHYALGFQHNLSKRTRLWVEYVGSNNSDIDDLGDVVDFDTFQGDNDSVSLGVRHDF